MVLLQTLSMPSKWQQSIGMVLGHSVNQSHWEVNLLKKKKKLIAMMAMYGTVSVCAAVAKV